MNATTNSHDNLRGTIIQPFFIIAMQFTATSSLFNLIVTIMMIFIPHRHRYANVSHQWMTVDPLRFDSIRFIFVK